MANLNKIYYGIALLVLIAFSCGKDDKPAPTPPPKPGSVQGRVLNGFNQVLTGVSLTIQGNGINQSAVTDIGHYRFDKLKAGSYNITVKRDGYIELAEAISITAGDTLTKDFSLTAGTAYFTLLSDSLITASAFAKTYKIKVASNTNWVVNSSSDWLVPENPGAAGDDSIGIQVRASTLDTPRTGKLLLQAGSIVKMITITQLADVKLKGVMPLPGNNAKSISDSVALQFNQPVTIKSIIPGNTFCQSDIRFSFESNKVTFSYACAAIGGEYPFTITTLNSIGDQYAFTFKVSFFEKALDLTGSIRNYFVNDADNSYWLLTDNPNALYKIDMTTLQIVKRYDMSNEVTFFTINPYNNKIYFAYRRVPKLFVMNQDGTMDQTIDIVRDSTRGISEYDGPYVNPVNLCFTKSGKGMIWLCSSDIYSGPYHYWFIDAADNHRIWYEGLPEDFTVYENGLANFDRTKLILNYKNDDPTIGIFDPQMMQFSGYKPIDMSGSAGVNNIPSRKNGYVYSNGIHFHRIVDPLTGFETSSLRKDGIFGAIDFCYKDGREKSVYYANAPEGKIEVIDYSAAPVSPVVYDAVYFMQALAATLNGQHIIMSRHDGNYNIKVFQLKTSWFDY